MGWGERGGMSPWVIAGQLADAVRAFLERPSAAHRAALGTELDIFDARRSALTGTAHTAPATGEPRHEVDEVPDVGVVVDVHPQERALPGDGPDTALLRRISERSELGVETADAVWAAAVWIDARRAIEAIDPAPVESLAFAPAVGPMPTMSLAGEDVLVADYFVAKAAFAPTPSGTLPVLLLEFEICHQSGRPHDLVTRVAYMATAEVMRSAGDLLHRAANAAADAGAGDPLADGRSGDAS